VAVAEIIGAAVGVLLLIIVAYIVVGSTLSTAETVSNAQKDLTLQHESRLQTSFVISDKSRNGPVVNISITNTGTEVISDFSHMNIFTYTDGDIQGYRHLIFDKMVCGAEGTWCIPEELGIVPDIIHPNQLDPGEKMWIMATSPSGTAPDWCQVTTGNGVYAAAYL
jgi:flagellar protein FlaF